MSAWSSRSVVLKFFNSESYDPYQWDMPVKGRYVLGKDKRTLAFSSSLCSRSRASRSSCLAVGEVRPVALKPLDLGLAPAKFREGIGERAWGGKELAFL